METLLEEGETVIRYDPHFFTNETADEIFEELLALEPSAINAQGKLMGKDWFSDRKTIQIADEGISYYRFTGADTAKPRPFSDFPILEKMRRIIWGTYNACLINYYTPEASIGFHSDAEKDLVEGNPIASFTFGDPRKFRVKRKSDQKIVLELYPEHGSLLLMEGTCQKTHQHAINKITKEELKDSQRGLRINVTFRLMKQ